MDEKEQRQIFVKAAKEYGEAVGLLRAIAEVQADIRKKNGASFDPDIFCRQYDVLLQYSLIELAASDEHASGTELAFINSITNYGDIVRVLNAKHKTDLTWEAIVVSDNASLRRLLDAWRPAVDDICEEFTNDFALVDAIIPQDLLKTFVDRTASILSCLMSIDGDFSDAEQNSLSANYITKVIGGINEKVGHFESFINK